MKQYESSIEWALKLIIMRTLNSKGQPNVYLTLKIENLSRALLKKSKAVRDCTGCTHVSCDAHHKALNCALHRLPLCTLRACTWETPNLRRPKSVPFLRDERQAQIYMQISQGGGVLLFRRADSTSACQTRGLNGDQKWNESAAVVAHLARRRDKMQRLLCHLPLSIGHKIKSLQTR